MLITGIFVLPVLKDVEGQQNLFADRQANMQHVIEKSHRTIIFLTSNFIRDEWNMLALNKVKTGLES